MYADVTQTSSWSWGSQHLLHLHVEFEVTLEHHRACLDELRKDCSAGPVRYQRRQGAGGVAEPHDPRKREDGVIEVHVCAVHVDLSIAHGEMLWSVNGSTASFAVSHMECVFFFCISHDQTKKTIFCHLTRRRERRLQHVTCRYYVPRPRALPGDQI